MPETIDKNTVIAVELEKDGHRKMIRYQWELESHLEDGWDYPRKAGEGEETVAEVVEIKLVYEEGDKNSLVEAAMEEYDLKLSKRFSLDNLISQVAEWEAALTEEAEALAGEE